MEGIIIWGVIIIPSALWGVFCAYKIKSKYAVFIAGAIPWLGLLVSLLYTVYWLPHDTPDASMWPIAQLFGGTIMAFIGVCAYKFVCKYKK